MRAADASHCRPAVGSRITHSNAPIGSSRRISSQAAAAFSEALERPAQVNDRLAVDRRYTNLGIGTSLTVHALATAVEFNEKAACRAINSTSTS